MGVMSNEAIAIAEASALLTQQPRPSEAYIAMTLMDVRQFCADVHAGKVDPEPWREEIEDAAIELSRLIGRKKA